MLQPCCHTACLQTYIRRWQEHPCLWDSCTRISGYRVHLSSKKPELIGNFAWALLEAFADLPTWCWQPSLSCSCPCGTSIGPMKQLTRWLRTWLTSVRRLQEADNSLDVAALAVTLVALAVTLVLCRVHVLVCVCMHVNFLLGQTVLCQVREYNQGAPERAQLLGQKGQAVKQLLTDLSADTQNLLISTTIERGWESAPWTDEGLASKKWLPGYRLLSSKSSRSKHYPPATIRWLHSPRIKNNGGPVWKARGVVTQESCHMMAPWQLQRAV